MEWKQIADLGYEVSTFGIVRNIKRKNIMAQMKLGNTDYPAVFLEVCGKQKAFSVHRLVAIAFLPNPENKKEVNHKDGNKKNNMLSNLEWVTRKENIQHMYDTGLKKYRPLHYKNKYGSEHNRSKAVRCIETGQFFGSMSEAGRNLNISYSSVSWAVKHKKSIFGMHFEISE